MRKSKYSDVCDPTCVDTLDFTKHWESAFELDWGIVNITTPKLWDHKCFQIKLTRDARLI